MMPIVKIKLHSNKADQNKAEVVTEFTLKSKTIPSKKPKSLNSRIKAAEERVDAKSKE